MLKRNSKFSNQLRVREPAKCFKRSGAARGFSGRLRLRARVWPSHRRARVRSLWARSSPRSRWCPGKTGARAGGPTLSFSNRKRSPPSEARQKRLTEVQVRVRGAEEKVQTEV